MTRSDNPHNNDSGVSATPGSGGDQQPDRTDFDRVQGLLGSRYQLNWIIGRGGMSTVWLARDTEEQRDVAVKILKPEYTDNEEFRTRFRNEAQAAEQLNSPNVVTTYDYGEVRDRGAVLCYIIMEYVSGESLADVLSREYSLDEPLVLDILAQTARGLQAIHAKGMVHRDIKPGNLLITSDGVVKVTDLGIAKAAAAVPLTRTGMVVGTAQYVSPEQAQGNTVGPASDIYSLGVVGYEALAGERPFAGESTVSVAIKHISEDPRPLPETVGQNMRELIGICLRKNPAARYSDGEELAAATVLVAEGQRPPQPHRVPEVENFHDHPLTEQLGTVAQGPGTRVPPMQGPTMAGNRGGNAGASSPRRHPAPSNSRPARGNGPANNGGPRSVRPSNQRPAPKKSSSAPVVIVGLLAALAVGVAGYFLLNGSDDKAPGTQTRTVTSRVSPPGNSNENSGSGNQSPGDPAQGNGDGQGNGWFKGPRGDGDNNAPTDTTSPRNGGGEGQRPTRQPGNPQPAPQPDSPSQPGAGNGGADNGNSNGGAGQGNSESGNGGSQGNSTMGGGNPGENPQANRGDSATGNDNPAAVPGQFADNRGAGGQVQPTAALAYGNTSNQRNPSSPVIVAAVKNVNNVEQSTMFPQQGQLL